MSGSIIIIRLSEMYHCSSNTLGSSPLVTREDLSFPLLAGASAQRKGYAECIAWLSVPLFDTIAMQNILATQLRTVTADRDTIFDVV